MMKPMIITRPARSLSTLRKLCAQTKKELEVKDYTGEHHKRAKRVYLWGNARTGALGVPKFLEPEKPDRSPVFTQSKPYNFHWPVRASFKVKHVAAGYGFTVYAGRSRDRSLVMVGCGINTDSQIGYHSDKGSPVDYVITPQFFELPISEEDGAVCTSVACGRAHTVIATNKAVFTLGNNVFGQCGRTVVEGEKYGGSRVIHTVERDDIIKAVCGYDHTLLLSADGSVYSCGLGTDGQTGLGNFECASTFTKLQGALTGKKIVDIDCKCDTVLAVSDEGEVFGWGNSEYGQFDIVTQDPQINTPTHLPISSICGKVEKVAAAATNCAIVNDRGEVYVWGYGVLGKGPELQQSVEPELIPMTLFGMNTFSQDIRVEKVFSGVNCFAAVTNTKALYTWGKNAHGCLGLGHKNVQYFPFMVSVGSEVNDVACGADHVVTLCRSFV